MVPGESGFKEGTWVPITERPQSTGGSRMNIIDVSVHTHTMFLEADSTGPHVCVPLCLHVCTCTHARTHTQARTQPHTSSCRWRVIPPRSSAAGAEVLSPFRYPFVHSFIFSINFAFTVPLCQPSCWAWGWQKRTCLGHREGTAGLGWGLGAQQARG